MAIDVCSEISSIGISPRISFSHDLNQTDVVPTEQNNRRSDKSLLDCNGDFNFCIAESFLQEPSSADELFSNGKILPMKIKKKLITITDIQQSQATLSPPQPSFTTTENSKKKCLKEFLAMSSDQEQENPPLKFQSFWQFRRSTSLNCDNSRRMGLIRSLNFLSRSNSTGSAPNQKQTMPPKETQKYQNSQKQHSFASAKSSTPCSNNYYPYNSSQKPPLKKNCRSYGNGVRISPVLNLPPHYISRGSVSLFSFGSLFCNGKDKKKKK